MLDDVARVVVSERQIEARVAAMAEEIASFYADSKEGVTIVTILTGSLVFLADLIRRLPIRMRVALVTVSSYAGKTMQSRGAVLESAILPDLCNRDVLIVDDILDTGGTLRLVRDRLRAESPRSIRTAVMLRKRDKAPADLPVEFVGFDIEDEFVVGYGLDYDGLYRNLPYIGVLKPELYTTESIT